jgi:pimeloyl-ACP methyl ester carboxylesterase
MKMTITLDPPDTPEEFADQVVGRRVVVDGPHEPVPGRLTVPAGNPTPTTLVLLGHGGGGGKDEGRFPALAVRFATGLDAAVLVLDGPAHGERRPVGTDPVDTFRLGRKALVDPDMPRRFAEEYRAAVDALRAEGIGTGPLLYAGFSMGTLLGVPAVAHLGEVAGAVFGVGGVPAEGGVGELVRGSAGDQVADIVNELDDVELRGRILLEAAAELSDTQVLMINTTRDIVFPVENAFELFDTFTCPKRIMFWEGGHTDLTSEAIGLATDFLVRVRDGLDQGETQGAW